MSAAKTDAAKVDATKADAVKANAAKADAADVRTFTLTGNLRRDGQTFPAGEPVELSRDEHAEMLAIGFLTGDYDA